MRGGRDLLFGRCRNSPVKAVKTYCRFAAPSEREVPFCERFKLTWILIERRPIMVTIVPGPPLNDAWLGHHNDG